MRFSYLIKLTVLAIIFIMISSALPGIILGEVTDAEKREAEQTPDSANTEDTMFVKGHVIDRNTGKGVPYSVVHFNNDDVKYLIETGDNGDFAIELPPGHFLVLIEARGYQELHEEVAGRPDQVIDVKYPLFPVDDEEVPPDGRVPPPPRDEERPPEDEVQDGDRFVYEANNRDYVIRDDLGGGSSVIFRNGETGSHLAVIYGTVDRPNVITILAYYKRYVGAADLYDENGVLIGKNEPIIVTTIFKQSFTHLMEYNDTNGDGLRNTMEKIDNTALSDRKFQGHEPVYKVVSLNTVWKRSDVRETTYRNSIKEYSFDLVARNLPYTAFGNPEKVAARGTLDLVKFTFHIILKKDDVTRDDIPVFKIDVETEDEEVKDFSRSKFKEHRSYSGSRISSKIKYDYMIGGWDYDESNNDPRLFLEMFLSIMHTPESRLARWMMENTIEENQRFNEKLQYSDKSGAEKEMYVEHNEAEDKYELVENTESDNKLEPVPGSRGAETDPPTDSEQSEHQEYTLKNFESPELVDDNGLKFTDNIYSTGSFSWLNNVTADGKNSLIKFQILKVGYVTRIIEGKLYSGMQLVGGFNLPGAVRIYHDPTLANEIFELNIEAEEVQGRPVATDGILFSASVLAIIIIIILIGFYGMVNSALERKMKPPKIPKELPPPPPPPKTVMDKDKFKSKKTADDEYYESYYVDWED